MPTGFKAVRTGFNGIQTGFNGVRTGFDEVHMHVVEASLHNIEASPHRDRIHSAGPHISKVVHFLGTISFYPNNKLSLKGESKTALLSTTS